VATPATIMALRAIFAIFFILVSILIPDPSGDLHLAGIRLNHT
jgi:hypothetical protein